MRWLAAPLAVALLACAALGQDDGVETRRFAVGFLTSRPADTSGGGLGLAQDAIGTSISAGEEIAPGVVHVEDLLDLLRRDVAPESWKAEGMSIEADERGVLVAVNRRSVLDGVAAWIARARARHARRIAVDVALVVVPYERWGRVEPRDLQGVSKVLKAARVFAAPGSRVHAQEIAQLAYVRDYDVQISTAAAGLDPIVDVLNTGAWIELRVLPAPSGDRLVFDVRAEAAAFEGLDDRTLKLQLVEGTAELGAAGGALATAAKPWEGLVQLPRTTFDRVRGRAAASSGETVIAASAGRADGVLALLLTPAFVADGAPAAADPAGAFTRLYDVGAIVARVQDWAAPRADLAGPGRGGGGPLTGATFTLDEPREGFGMDKLEDALAALAGPKNVTTSAGGTLAVLAPAEAQARVEKLLAEIYAREARTLSTEAAIVAFKAGARAEWAKTVAALAPGGSRAPDAAVQALLEEARKGAAVRLAGWASIGGRPGQRVHLISGRQRNYVQDFEPQMSTAAGCYDPIIGVLLTGFGLDACPTPRADDGSMDLRVKAWLTEGELLEEKKLTSGGGPLQRARLAGPVWETELVCLPGHWSLAGLETRGDEELALFVRVR